MPVLLDATFVVAVEHTAKLNRENARDRSHSPVPVSKDFSTITSVWRHLVLGKVG